MPADPLLSDKSEIGGHLIEHVLMPEETYLATAPGGRRVVLKVLEADCLLGRQLHPSIKDRLGRVREIAHLAVANLHGVERDGAIVYAVWEYLPGESLAEWAEDRALPLARIMHLARELALTLEGLHDLGLVHGALHEHNVIVHEDKARLTHVSPLLYTDPAADKAALQAMLKRICQQRQESSSPLAELLAGEAMPMRELVGHLTALLENTSRRAEPIIAADPEDRRARRRGGMAVLLAVCMGVALFITVRWATRFLIAS